MSKIRICSLCSEEIQEGESYCYAKAYHKKCFSKYSNERKKTSATGGKVVTEYWNEPLPEKEGGLFDYDKYFESQGLPRGHGDESIHAMPVHKLRLPKRRVA